MIEFVVDNTPLFDLSVEKVSEQEFDLVLELLSVTINNGLPIHVGSEPPPNPQEGQLWFQI